MHFLIIVVLGTRRGRTNFDHARAIYVYDTRISCLGTSCITEVNKTAPENRLFARQCC